MRPGYRRRCDHARTRCNRSRGTVRGSSSRRSTFQCSERRVLRVPAGRPLTRVLATQWANAARSSAAWSAVKSISYTTPSWANVTVSSAVTPSPSSTSSTRKDLNLPIGPKTLPRDFKADSSRRQKVVRSGEAKERQVRRNLPDGWRENLHRRETSIRTSMVKSHTTPARRFPRTIARVGAGTGRVGAIHSRPVSRCYPATISSCPASFTAVDLTVALLAGHQVRARQCRLSHQRSTTFEPMSVRKV